MRLLPIADVTEGQSLDVCVVAESQSAQTIGFDMTVTLTITDGSASMYITLSLLHGYGYM